MAATHRIWHTNKRLTIAGFTRPASCKFIEAGPYYWDSSPVILSTLSRHFIARQGYKIADTRIVTRVAGHICLLQHFHACFKMTYWWTSLIIATNIPDSKVHGANMGPIWGRQGPSEPHVGPMNLAIWDVISIWYLSTLTIRDIITLWCIAAPRQILISRRQ